MWEIGNTLLFFEAGLDPNVTHSLELMALGQTLMLNSVTAFASNATASHTIGSATTASVSSPSSQAGVSGTSSPSGTVTRNSDASQKLNAGTIAGSVVGVVLGLSVICALLWIFLRRRSSPGPITPYSQTTSASRSTALDSDSQGAFIVYEKWDALLNEPSPSVPSAQSHGRSGSSDASRTAVDLSHVSSASAEFQAHLPQSQSQHHHTSSTSAMQTVNVDRIIELIAERIDRRDTSSSRDIPDAPPPQYPAQYAQ